MTFKKSVATSQQNLRILHNTAMPCLRQLVAGLYPAGPVSIPGRPKWDFGGRGGTGTGFFLGISLFPCQYHATNAPQTFHSQTIDAIKS